MPNPKGINQYSKGGAGKSTKKLGSVKKSGGNNYMLDGKHVGIVDQGRISKKQEAVPFTRRVVVADKATASLQRVDVAKLRKI